MNSLDIKFIKKFINTNINIDEIEIFFKNYEKIKDIILNYKWLENVKKIPNLNKNKKVILQFIEENQYIINEFIKVDILYEMTSGFDIKYHWQDIYKPVILDIRKVGKEKVLKVIEQLENKNFKYIKFTTKEFSKIFYEKINKKYNKNEYELEYYFTDGKKKYLARYYNDSYPIVIENAKVIFIVRENNFINNDNEVYLNTFDIDLENINISNNINDILKILPNEEIDMFTNMCEYIRNLEKTINLVKTNKKIIEKLIQTKEIKDFYINELNRVSKQIKELENQKECVIETYKKYGYSKNFIDMNLKYLNDMEWQSHIDID